jgi:hypothetical protein
MTAPLLLTILAPHFTAGVEVGERAAPIIQYMQDWDEQTIRAYCEKKGWDVYEVDPDDLC